MTHRYYLTTDVNEGGHEYRVYADSPEDAARIVFEGHEEARVLTDYDDGDDGRDGGERVAWLHVMRDDLPPKQATPERAFDDRYWEYKYIRRADGTIEFFGADN